MKQLKVCQNICNGGKLGNTLYYKSTPRNAVRDSMKAKQTKENYTRKS